MKHTSSLVYLFFIAFVFSKNRYFTVWANTEIIVATYNLWNVMFMWETRKFYIAEMITQSNADVIGFQEVRSDATDERNQLRELQSLLGPEYKYYSYHPVTTVLPALGETGPPGWEREGVGIISKFPIMLSHTVKLKRSIQSPDKNKRVLFHAQLNVKGEELDVTLVHFSYDKQQQCQNALDLINYQASSVGKRSVIMGDFNVYEDFPWPVSAVSKGSLGPDGLCKPDKYFVEPGPGRGYGYVDAWLEKGKGNQDKQGYTFSNMPNPGLVSRPDRILASKQGLEIFHARLLGGDKAYMKSAYYRYLNKWNRLVTVLRYANASGSSPLAYTCHQDCGPHGSCRCGVCVRGGNQNNCDLQYCYECDSVHYNTFLSLSIFFIIYCILLFYIVIKYLSSRYLLSRSRRLNSHRLFFLLSNRNLLVFLIALCIVFYFLVILNFSDMLETVNSVLPEEMFPSDHLMVLAQLEFT